MLTLGSAHYLHSNESIMKRLKAIWYDFCVIYNRSLTTKPYIPVSRSRGWCVKKKKYITAGLNPCSGTKYSSTEPLHYLAMFGHPSGLTIGAGFCSDNPSGMLWIFDQKCSDYIRQKAKNFSKSVRTIIWVRHLYSGVLVARAARQWSRKVRKWSLQNVHSLDPTVRMSIQNKIPTTLQRSDLDPPRSGRGLGLKVG